MYVPVQNMNCVTRVFNTVFFLWRLFCDLPLCTQLIVLNVISPVLKKQCVQHIFEGWRAQKRDRGQCWASQRERGFWAEFARRSHIPPQCSFFTVTGSVPTSSRVLFSVLALLHILLGWTPQPSVSASLLVVGTILYIGRGGMQNLQSSRTVKVWI